MVGEKIEKILSEKRITKKELIEKSGVSKAGLHSIIKGVSSPSIETLNKIAEALDVSLITFLGDDLSSSANKDFNLEIGKLKDEKTFLTQKLSASKLGYKQQISLLKALTFVLKELKDKKITINNLNNKVLNEIDQALLNTYQSYYKDIYGEKDYHDFEFDIWVNKIKS